MTHEASAIEFHGDETISVERIIKDPAAQLALSRELFHVSLREAQDTPKKEEGEE